MRKCEWGKHEHRTCLLHASCSHSMVNLSIGFNYCVFQTPIKSYEGQSSASIFSGNNLIIDCVEIKWEKRIVFIFYIRFVSSICVVWMMWSKAFFFLLRCNHSSIWFDWFRNSENRFHYRNWKPEKSWFSFLLLGSWFDCAQNYRLTERKGFYLAFEWCRRFHENLINVCCSFNITRVGSIAIAWMKIKNCIKSYIDRIKLRCMIIRFHPRTHRRN